MTARNYRVWAEGFEDSAHDTADVVDGRLRCGVYRAADGNVMPWDAEDYSVWSTELTKEEAEALHKELSAEWQGVTYTIEEVLP